MRRDIFNVLDLLALENGVGENQRRGRRWSATRAFLRPVLHRPNLTVLTGALVELVVTETRDGAARAVGVAAGLKTLRRVLLVPLAMLAAMQLYFSAMETPLGLGATHSGIGFSSTPDPIPDPANG